MICLKLYYILYYIDADVKKEKSIRVLPTLLTFAREDLYRQNQEDPKIL